MARYPGNVGRLRYRWLSGALVILAITGCTSWRASKLPPERLAAEKPRVTIRVTTPGEPPFVLRHIRVMGDTLYGSADRAPHGVPVTGSKGHFAVAVPHEQIRKLEVLEGDPLKTVMGLASLTAVVIIVGGMAESADKAMESSCPTVLCPWEGRWVIDSGTYTGAIMPALARSDVDNLEHAAERDGRVHVRLTGLSHETEHVDALSLLVVDHPADATVAPDAEGRLWILGPLAGPGRAADLAGRDALPRVGRRDEWCWESALEARDSSSAGDLRDGLYVEFARPSGARSAQLVIDAANTPWAAYVMRAVVDMHGKSTEAWYADVAADPYRAARIRRTMARESFLQVSLRTGRGWEHQGWLPLVAHECLKRQVVPLDLGRAVGDTVRVRLECAPNFWDVDCVSIDYSPPREASAVRIDPEAAWTMQGRDVRGPLAGEDGKEYVIVPGDSADIWFRVPPLRPGVRRSYLARATGWYRIHTSETGEFLPEVERLETEPGAVARFAVTRMNEALSRMGARPRLPE